MSGINKKGATEMSDQVDILSSPMHQRVIVMPSPIARPQSDGEKVVSTIDTPLKTTVVHRPIGTDSDRNTFPIRPLGNANHER